MSTSILQLLLITCEKIVLLSVTKSVHSKNLFNYPCFLTLTVHELGLGDKGA